MEYVKLEEASVPKLGLGTWQLERDQARQVVEEAIDLGYRHIDTAQMYHNEAEVGQAILASGIDRKEYFITTKVWRENLAYDQLLASVDQSLERLGIGYVDLLLIHWPNEAIALRETLTALEAVRREGRARLIGVSNFPEVLLKVARQLAPIRALQVEWHPFLDQSKLRQRARDAGMLFTAYCPLARGEVFDDPLLKTIGERHGKSPGQVALRWLTQHQHVAAIPKGSSREHLAQNIDIFDFLLSEEEMVDIAALARGERLIDPEFAPNW